MDRNLKPAHISVYLLQKSSIAQQLVGMLKSQNIVPPPPHSLHADGVKGTRAKALRAADGRTISHVTNRQVPAADNQ